MTKNTSAPVAHIYAPGNESRTICGKVDTFDSVWSLAWVNNEGRITCDACRRLASIDARMPRPTHIYSPSAPTDAVCGGCEYGHHITTDVHEATCAQCLRVHADAMPMVDIARRRGDWYTLPAGVDIREQGPGIVDVPSVPQRVAVAVGYDDPTGDDVAADVGPRR